MRSVDHPLYYTYSGMKERCNRPDFKQYADYGGRGVKIHPSWLVRKTGFWQFVKDVGPKPVGHTLDRIDNDGDYEPDNVKWSTPSEQQTNKRIQSNNESGFIGVGFHKQAGKWRARITRAGITENLGLFDTVEAAVLARKLRVEDMALQTK